MKPITIDYFEFSVAIYNSVSFNNIFNSVQEDHAISLVRSEPLQINKKRRFRAVFSLRVSYLETQEIRDCRLAVF
ncbi:hypothetical protein E2C01_014941 [Portunus trituberculatus]|uniref:Uncharacterized protein n=1 Tax=Portunus trituberculatus TaxID=210409 RepID=A0A5B7DLD5_PORTR|nr:hypothetical protein [Portunus trituberculatus]